MIVTFCGHAQISQSEKIEQWLYDVTQRLIEQGATTFYLGGYGEFDRLAADINDISQASNIAIQNELKTESTD